MNLETWLLFSGAALVVILIPGPLSLLMISNSLNYGLRRSYPAFLGGVFAYANSVNQALQRRAVQRRPDRIPRRGQEHHAWPGGDCGLQRRQIKTSRRRHRHLQDRGPCGQGFDLVQAETWHHSHHLRPCNQDGPRNRSDHFLGAVADHDHRQTDDGQDDEAGQGRLVAQETATGILPQGASFHHFHLLGERLDGFALFSCDYHDVLPA